VNEYKLLSLYTYLLSLLTRSQKRKEGNHFSK